MSQYPKRAWLECAPVVEFFIRELAPACEVISVGGSYRREKPLVGDLEIVFVPKVISEPDGLFDSIRVSLADKMIESWLATGVIKKRLAATSRFSSWGPLNKHAHHVVSGIGVDFFAEPDIRDWGRTLAVRTGPAEFNVRLMATAPRHGLNAHAYGPALDRIGNGERVFAATEREFIELCGLPYQEPKDRR